MEVEYQITADDLFAFQWRAAYESRRGRRYRRMAYVYLFVALLLLTIMGTISSEGFVISQAVFLAIPFIIVALIYWLLVRRLTRKAILELLRDEKPDKGQLGMHKLVLDEKGVVETTAVGESRTLWAGVDRVEQNGGYIFIYTTPAAAHVIPKRAFENAQQAESFYALARLSQQIAAP